MKKILLLLLLATFSIQAQTLQNPTYGNVKLKNNTTDNSATKVNVQSTDGTINTISKSDLVNVVEVNDVPSLPLVGEVGKIYVVKNVNKIYRWNGTFYQELAGSDLNYQSVIDALGFTPENVANKTSGFTTSSTTTYPNTKALVDALATKQNTSTVTDFDKAYAAPYTSESIRNSEADIVVLNSGNYLTAYTKFGRVATDFSPSSIVCKISTNSTGTEWSDEIVVSPNIGAQNVISVSLIRIDVSTIHCFFLVRNSFTDLELNRVVSTDEGLTWGSPIVITNNGYTDILNASVKRGNSNRILISGESVPDGSAGILNWDIFCYRSDDNGATYTKSNIVNVSASQGETSVVWTGGDNVMLSTRTTDGFQWFTKSTDNGTTFGTPFKSTLKSVDAPAQLVAYGSTLIAIHNPNTIDNIRLPLSISKSIDGGTTWTLIGNINLPRPSYYRYAYPSITLDGDYMLVSYYEISGDAGQGLKFSKIYVPDLLNGISSESDSPNNLFLKGLTFDKSEIIQPEDNVLGALGKIQAQINKKNGADFSYVGEGAGVILRNDRSDNVMQSQFISYRNTDGSVVTNVGHISTSQDYEVFTSKEVSFSTPLFKVNSASDFFGKAHITTPSLQMHLEGSSQASFDMEKTGGYKIRMFVDSNNFGFYNFNNGLVPLEISNTTAIVNFSQIPTAPTAPAGTNTTQIATTAFVQANSLALTGGTLSGAISGTSATFSSSVEATQYKISALNTAPASATATGTTGEIRITSGFIYICIATNTWVRSALTTWI